MKNGIFYVVVLCFLYIPTAIPDDSLAGVYVNEELEKSGGRGKLLLYPVSTNIYLFSIKLNRGAPSYSSGHLFGEIKVNGSTSIYENNEYEFRGKGCKWKINFNKGVATIGTIDFSNNCGMGNGVYVDGSYAIKSKVPPKTYINVLGNEVEFSDKK